MSNFLREYPGCYSHHVLLDHQDWLAWNDPLEKMRRMDIVWVIGEEDPFRENNEHLCRILVEKRIGHRTHYWAERAHRGHYWRQMGPVFV